MRGDCVGRSSLAQSARPLLISMAALSLTCLSCHPEPVTRESGPEHAGDEDPARPPLLAAPAFLQTPIALPSRPAIPSNDPIEELAQFLGYICARTRAGIVRCALLRSDRVLGPFHPGPLRDLVERFDGRGTGCMVLRSGERWCLSEDEPEELFSIWPNTLPVFALSPAFAAPPSSAALRDDDVTLFGGVDRCGVREDGAATCWSSPGVVHEASSADIEDVLNDATAPSWWSSPDDRALAEHPVVALASSGERCGILDTGHVVCWYAPRGVSIAETPATLVPFVSDARGLRSFSNVHGHATCALTQAREIRCWGTRTQSSSVIAIPGSSAVVDWAVMEARGAVLLENGEVHAWHVEDDGVVWARVLVDGARHVSAQCVVATSPDRLACWTLGTEDAPSVLEIPAATSIHDAEHGFRVFVCIDAHLASIDVLHNCGDIETHGDVLHPERTEPRCAVVRPRPLEEDCDRGPLRRLDDGQLVWSRPYPLWIGGSDDEGVSGATAEYRRPMPETWTIREDGECWSGPGGTECMEAAGRNLGARVPPESDWVWVGGLDDVVEVASADDHSCARTRGGGVWCWGRNEYGQSGVGPDPMDQAQEVIPSDALALSMSPGRSCGLMENGEVWCWGGERIDHPRMTDYFRRNVAARVEGLPAAQEIRENCARVETQWWCWDVELRAEPAAPPATESEASFECELSAGRVRCRGSLDMLGAGHSGIGPFRLRR